MEARFSIQLALVILEQSFVTVLLHSFVHVRLDRRLQSFEEMPIVLPADSIWQVDEEGPRRSVSTGGAANIGGESCGGGAVRMVQALSWLFSSLWHRSRLVLRLCVLERSLVTGNRYGGAIGPVSCFASSLYTRASVSLPGWDW